MKLIIAGSRTLNVSHFFIRDVLVNLGFKVSLGEDSKIDEIVSGTANGIDLSGEKFAKRYVFGLKRFPADWDSLGKAAGHIRNKQMAEYADALLLIWDGESKGSANMKKEMEKLGKPVYEIIVTTESKKETKAIIRRRI